MVEASPHLKPWRSDVRERFIGKMPEYWSMDGAKSMKIEFLFARAKSHYTGTGLLSSRAPMFPRRGDVDKLARAVLDALTGIAYEDDSQVCELLVTKRYCLRGEAFGAGIRIFQDH